MKKFFPLLTFCALFVLSSITFLTAQQVAPVTTAANISGCAGVPCVSIPVTVTGFTKITALSLRMEFNSTNITFCSYANINPVLSGLTYGPPVLVNGSTYRLMVTWVDIIPRTLAAGAKLFDVNFNLVNGNGTLVFNNSSNGSGDCEYADSVGNALPDLPTGSFYHHASVTIYPLPTPTITGPSPVCVNSAGEIYTTDAGMTGYSWTVSPGGEITSGSGTDAITVTWNAPGPQWVQVSYQGIYCSSLPCQFAVMVDSSTIAGEVTGGGTIFFGMETTMDMEGSRGSVLKWQKRWNGGSWQDIANTLATYFEVPDTTGTWDYRTEVRNGNCLTLFSGFTTITVQSVTRIIDLTIFLEGLYDPATQQMNKAQDVNGDKFPGTIADQIQFRLAKPRDPYSVYYSVNDIDLNQDGTCTFTIPRTGYYYLVIKHRNSIETWSSTPISLLPDPFEYDFSTAASKAYGNNLKELSGKWVIYVGEVYQDGLIDLSDMVEVEAAINLFTVGYLIPDVNGDGLVDLSDMIITEQNINLFISSVLP